MYIYAVNNLPFAEIWQKSAYHAKYLEYPGPILTYFTGLVGVLVGMIIQIFVWRSPKGRCYGNQLNLGDVRKLCMEIPLLFALAFDNGLADHKSAFKMFNGNNQATLCRNLVNFRPRFARNLTTIFIRHVGVSKRIGRSQF